VDLFVSPQKLAQVKCSTDKAATLNDGTGTPTAGGHVALRLSFLRSVGTNKVVDAIVDALKADGEEYQTALGSFKTILVSNIGPSGIVTNDEIAFVLGTQDALDIRVRGDIVGKIVSHELRANLLAIYIGEKTLVPSLRVAFLASQQ
jgi:hypothetical protein